MSEERKEVSVLGAGGHARNVIALIRRLGWTVRALLDDDPALLGKERFGLQISAGTGSVATPEAVLAIGNNQQRRAMDQRLGEVEWPPIVHPSAILGDEVTLGPGAIIMAGAIIQEGVHIGRHTIVNSGAVIEHDCTIGRYAHVASNATLAGGVRVGEGGFVGAAATVLENREIGAWAIVGAGAVVIKHVVAKQMVAGVPAKEITHSGNRKTGEKSVRNQMSGR